MIAGNFKIGILGFINIILFAATGFAQLNTDERHILVSMRMIGHEVLLSSGDSVSRVLPIEKDADRYKIPFESGFQFNPEKLVATIDSVIKKTGIAGSYRAEVEKCETGEVVYSYEIRDSTSIDLIPCGTRITPKACYALFITILDDSGSVASLHTTTYFIIGLLTISLLIFVGWFVYFRKKRGTPNPSIHREDSDIVFIGDYKFDKKDMALSYGDEKTELSGKEADLLFLLYTNENKTLEREHILKIVWGDEGDYVGRTLDVFISKLRKKLVADSSIKIVNIRGIGYKLIINLV